MALIGVVAALALPKVSIPDLRADASARQVRMTLQAAARLAATRQYGVIVSFDTVNQTVRMVEDVNNDGVADQGERVTWHPLVGGTRFATPPVGLNGPVAHAVSGAGVQTIDGMPSVIFLRDGTINTSVEVYLTSNDPTADNFRGITVSRSNDRAVYEKYVNSTWTSENGDR
jgi:hypothetical protein